MPQAATMHNANAHVHPCPPTCPHNMPLPLPLQLPFVKPPLSSSLPPHSPLFHGGRSVLRTPQVKSFPVSQRDSPLPQGIPRCLVASLPRCPVARSSFFWFSLKNKMEPSSSSGSGSGADALHGSLLSSEAETYGYGCANAEPEQMAAQLEAARQLQEEE